mgnify:CR=1 FL=1
MKITLRPYQQDFINAVRNEFHKGNKRVVGVAPCGAGKTIMTGWMIREALKRGKRSIFFVHRKELIAQTAKTFFDLGIPFGIISAGAKMNINQPVQIASVQTLARRIVDKKNKPIKEIVDALNPDFLICDECHHILANTYKKVLDAFPNAYLLGVTATPERIGGVTLSDVFQAMVESLSVNELIELGNLTKFDYIASQKKYDYSQIKVQHGDFDNHQLEKLMTDGKIIGDTVDCYRQYADGLSCICYCVNVNHSKTVAAAFADAGINAAHCDGETPAKIRDSIVEDFRNGFIKVLCNADLFGEGFDVPACQSVILARPTKSLPLFIQQAMRPLRPDPNDANKIAVIIDQVQNCAIHGLPNIKRDWSLIPKDKKKIPCPNCAKEVRPYINHPAADCLALQQAYGKKYPHEKIRADVKIDLEQLAEDGKNLEYKFCPLCGYIFPKGESYGGVRHPKYSDDDDLSKLAIDFKDSPIDTPEEFKKKPTTPEEFLAIAKVKNYQTGWVAFQSLEFANSYEDCLHIAHVCGYKDGWAYHKWQERQLEIDALKTLQNARLVC